MLTSPSAPERPLSAKASSAVSTGSVVDKANEELGGGGGGASRIHEKFRGQRSRCIRHLWKDFRLASTYIVRIGAALFNHS